MPKGKPKEQVMIQCQMCGKLMVRQTSTHKFCADCRLLRDKEIQDNRTRKRHSGTLHNRCADCGVEIPPKRKFCDACKKRHIEENKIDRRPKRCVLCGEPIVQSSRGMRKHCSICSRALFVGTAYTSTEPPPRKVKPELSIRQVNDFAKGHDLSYGQISILRQQGKLTDNDIKEWLKQCQKQCG